MKQLFVLFYLLVILNGFSEIQIIDDPVKDFLQFQEDEREIYVPDRKDYLKLEIDVFGDGRKVVFLSFPGFKSGGEGNIWSAYVPNDKGYFRFSKAATDDLLVFRPDGYLVTMVDSLNARALLAYFPGKGGGDIYAYVFRKDGIDRIKLKSVSLDSEKSLDAVFKEYLGKKPYKINEKLEKIPLKNKTNPSNQRIPKREGETK